MQFGFLNIIFVNEHVQDESKFKTVISLDVNEFFVVVRLQFWCALQISFFFPAAADDVNCN